MNINQFKLNQIIIIFHFEQFGKEDIINYIPSFPDEKVSDLIEKYRNITNNHDPKLKFIYNFQLLNPSLTLAEAGISNNSNIFVIINHNIKGGGNWYDKEINIKFIRVSKNNIYNNNQEIIGILKLCLLKEVSQKLSEDDLKKLPDLINYIMLILSNGYIPESPDDKKKILKML